MEKRSAKFLLWSIVVSGILIVVAVGASYRILKTAPPSLTTNPSDTNTASETPSTQNPNTKRFNNTVYGYSFEYPAILVGGFQKLTPELEKSGVKESIVLETPRDSKDRLAVIVSVEDHADLVGKIDSFADSYEAGSLASGIQLTRTASKYLSVDGVNVLERTYSIQKSSMPYSMVRFATIGSRFYIFSVFRSSNNDNLLKMEGAIFDSIHFSTK